MPQTPIPPSTPPGPGADSAGEAALKDRFSAQFGSRDERAPDTNKAIGMPTAELRTVLATSKTTERQLPAIELSQDERDGFAGKRSPDLAHALALFRDALAADPEAVAALSISPALCTRSIALDGAANRMAAAGDLLENGGDNGDLLCSSLVDQLTLSTLNSAATQIKDPVTTGDQRGDLKVAFFNAFTKLAERAQKPQMIATVHAHHAAPYQQQITQQQADAADTHVLDAYLGTIKATPPDTTATPGAHHKTATPGAHHKATTPGAHHKAATPGAHHKPTPPKQKGTP